MKGFFHASDVMGKPDRFSLTVIPKCGKCGLYKTCNSPKMPVDGKGKKGILIVGEAPGKDEDAQGRPFVGSSGSLLQETLCEFGVDLRRDCWITNSVICRPPDNKIKDDRAIDYCRPNVVKALHELRPTVVILLGAKPVESVIGWLWKENTKGIGPWLGWQIPSQQLNAWICPTYHPSHILRNQNPRYPDVARLFFRRHLEQAIALEQRPWHRVPDYEQRIKLFTDPDEAIPTIRTLLDKREPIAFDYEADRLKPDHPDSRLVCCSVSDGKTAWVFPWHGRVIRYARRLLADREVPKIGWNLKYEDRWSRRLLGLSRGVRGWLHDGMLATHLLDSRKGICSLKFQAFVLLGARSYNDSLKPYLEAETGNSRNRIHEISLPKLMKYCGLDSLLTYKIAQIQMRQMEENL